MSKNIMKAPTKFELWVLRSMIFIGLFSLLYFFYFFLKPEYRGSTVLYLFLCSVLFYSALRHIYLWYHYYNISVPIAPQLKSRPTVDILTTYFPGEPYEMICGTLEAIQKITYPHTTYLCDEANDPYLIEQCKKLGVIHVTRNHRTDAKAGNINNALKIATGKIALILDPDHIPQPNFLDTVIPYFEDENIGFVQVVQAYYNKVHSLVARGAAEQTFHFYGPMMMSMNSYGTVNAIGANCTFRRSALDSIGGHAPGLAEDMHTSMLLHAKGWKSVYVPTIVATGMAPLDLTSYFKQQLKWARGVFELLYSVYPKIFKYLTFRQKIHYGFLPLHYVVGFIYLLSFATPIVALFTSDMPWTGNFLKFIAISLPVFVSTLCIRIYIQKWVIEKNERGFHVIGGLLQIITWWIFILGVVYTFFRKKVPYLPTPKTETGTNLLITIPNMIVAIISVAAIFYGLKTDITPFSIIMMVFAMLNAIFMLFSLFLATRLTNKNEILRNSLEREVIDYLKKIKRKFIDFSDHVFRFMRFIALPFLCLTLFLSFYAVNKLDKDKWANVEVPEKVTKDFLYKGVFYPNQENGLSQLALIDSLEKSKHVDFNLVSIYVPWGDSPEQGIAPEYLKKIAERGASPMITWEPWLNNFSGIDSLMATGVKDGKLKHITNGNYDAYIEKFAIALRAVKNPVFLRFAHEFDNPDYPWYSDDKHASKDYVDAWRHIHDIFTSAHADNVKWIWNPWKPNHIKEYFPGDAYVDWLGVDLLNYGKLGQASNWYSFEELYLPYRNAFDSISSKPVLLSEFGSLKFGGNQTLWLNDAIEKITNTYREIKGVVFFFSKFDKNFPSNTIGNPKHLDWTFTNVDFNKLSEFLEINQAIKDLPEKIIKPTSTYKPLQPPLNIKGVTYRKAENWLSNNYVADKDALKKDFRLMQEAGINTIKYRQSKIYDYNVLKYSEEYGIDVIYSFWIPSDIDFIVDTIQLKKLSQNILKTIKKYNYKKNIIGWNLSNDVWQKLSTHYRLQDLEQQRHAFLLWLKDVLNEAKKIDSKKFIAKDISISQASTIALNDMRSYDLKIDAYSAIVDEVFWLNEFLTFVKDRNLPLIIGGITPDDLTKVRFDLTQTPLLLTNWQNRWESHAVSFDGLLDFNGTKKEAYLYIQKYWKSQVTSVDLPEMQILKPALTLGGKMTITYYALVFKDGSWFYFGDKAKDKLSWMLTKKDREGHYIAIKKLGKGKHIEFEVPEEFEKYELVLTYVESGLSKSIKVNLNTHFSPLYQSPNKTDGGSKANIK